MHRRHEAWPQSNPARSSPQKARTQRRYAPRPHGDCVPSPAGAYPVSRTHDARLLYDRRAKEEREALDLAPYAFRSSLTLGRAHPETPDELRTEFERDRDRIVHSTAFRRLMYKTQVFVNRFGDQYRTRLSHSLEVAQVARSVGSALGLNVDLCEALALAHDLGHPPFGHRGEVALDEIMRPYGGFRHNAQVLRVVDRLERRSPDYAGLNLTREVRESLLKHESKEDWPAEFEPRPRHPYLEAQVVDLADSTAYDAHDIEDGLFARMFSEDELAQDSALWRRAVSEVEVRHPGFLAATDDMKLRVRRVTNQLLKLKIEDLIRSSHDRIMGLGLSNPEQARQRHELTIDHGPLLGPEVAELERTMYKRFYRHDLLVQFSGYARQVLGALFDGYAAQRDEMPPWYRSWADEVGLERAVCDYIAGMTDRYAEREYVRLVGPLPH